MSANEVELGRRLRAGEEAVLKDIAAQYNSRVSAWLNRSFDGRLPPGEDEDVMQEALLALWKNRDKFDPERDTLRAWLTGIAKNCARKHSGDGCIRHGYAEKLPNVDELDALAWHRREIVRPHTNSDEADDQAESTSDRSPPRCAWEKRLAIARELLADLSAKEREAFLAIGESGYPISHAAAADQLGVNANTFRARLKRARDKINRGCKHRGIPMPDWSMWIH